MGVGPSPVASETRASEAAAARAEGLCFSTQATLWVLCSMVAMVMMMMMFSGGGGGGDGDGDDGDGGGRMIMVMMMMMMMMMMTMVGGEED